MSTNNGHSTMGIAFFAVPQTGDDQGYIGAVLVTDERGIPKEFRCTHPVRSTVVQKALYGHNLESHMSFQLCGKPLLGALTSHPVACLVESRGMVVLRESVSVPVLYVQRLGEVLAVDSNQPGQESGSGPVSNRTLRLDSRLGGFQPLAVYCYPGQENDIELTRTALEQVFQYVDLLEPFERITTALVALAERDERFR